MFGCIFHGLFALLAAVVQIVNLSSLAEKQFRHLIDYHRSPFLLPYHCRSQAGAKKSATTTATGSSSSVEFNLSNFFDDDI